MATVVKRNGGFIDKFIGDAVMALFDEHESADQPSACVRALEASIEMQLALPLLNERLKERSWPPIRIGIGLHYGPVVMGTVGAEFRMDSTVLGDTVNTAARLESLTKLHHVSIILSQALLAQLPSDHGFQVQEIGAVSVQGKQQPVHIYKLEFMPEKV
jgi:adenylate cyclase